MGCMTRIQVAIDSDGYIREVASVLQFTGGGTATFDVTLSDFGCAGTVVMPSEVQSTPTPSGAAEAAGNVLERLTNVAHGGREPAGHAQSAI